MEKNMATIDQQFVEYIVKTLVNNPEKVAVERTIDEKGVLLTLTVDPSDVGRVIGKRGVTAQAIRVLLRALGTKQDARFNLKIINTDGGDGESEKEEPVKKSDEPKEEADEEATEDDVEEDVGDEEESDDESEEETSELAEKTRAELADLDDLDI
ncbi:MAG: KH domain-containing protein, partial [Candidatus Saccharibacteria bacterium]|nr:KH domain-containing protein [Candidatus Saccharibacteria bacterium]